MYLDFLLGQHTFSQYELLAGSTKRFNFAATHLAPLQGFAGDLPWFYKLPASPRPVCWDFQFFNMGKKSHSNLSLYHQHLIPVLQIFLLICKVNSFQRKPASLNLHDVVTGSYFLANCSGFLMDSNSQSKKKAPIQMWSGFNSHASHMRTE